MKSVFKHISAILLIAVFLLSALPSGVLSVRAAEGYKTGDSIFFGSYPQSDVTDSLGKLLDTQSGSWRSYRYFSGNGYYGNITPSDYMRYKDVTYNGVKYRGVTFDSYRPYCTGYTPNDNNQQSNGYLTGKVYWFRFDPIEWRVLDPSAGLIMCDSIIDSQAYSNYVVFNGTDGHGKLAGWTDPSQTYYANNYEKSSIRQWLNDDFYNTAFSAEEKGNVKVSALSNKGHATLNGTAGCEEYDAPSTNDRIFLLSYDEVKNSAYGFASDQKTNDLKKRLKGSDYAKCQGLFIDDSAVSSNEYSSWWLRSAYECSYQACFVNDQGSSASTGYIDINDTGTGVCPALRLQKLPSAGKVEKVSVSDLTLTYKKSGKVTPQITADPGASYKVTYSSSDPKTVSVDSEGNIKGLKTGTATVTVTVTDEAGGTVSDSCKVTVKLSFWQVLIKIFLFGWIWY